MRFNPLNKVAAICWATAAPLFLIANLVVGFAWSNPSYSWATNNISDLGNVGCGAWDTTRPRIVCSPWHDAMNLAFLLTAALLVAGLLLTWRSWGDGRAARWGRRLMLAGAVGLGLAGAFPADVNENAHLFAAVLVFFAGNLGLVVAGCVRGTGLLASLRPVTLTLGVLGLVGSVLFIAQQGPVLGVGGMERVAVFPLQVWACYAGYRLYTAARGRRSAEIESPAEQYA